MLGLSIDEMDDLDDILLEEVDDIRFIASEEFSDQYEKRFTIDFDKGQFQVSLPETG